MDSGSPHDVSGVPGERGLYSITRSYICALHILRISMYVASVLSLIACVPVNFVMDKTGHSDNSIFMKV